MISSRASNRSSLASKITRSQLTVKKVVSSSQYMEMCKNNDRIPEEIVYDSLVGYEKQIKIMKASLLVCEAKNNFHRKQLALRKINDFSHAVPVPLQPLSEEEKLSIKPTYLTDKVKECRQLAQLLQERQENQRRAQQQFLRAITQQYQEDNLKSIEGAINIERLLNRKVFKIQQQAFTDISRKAYPQKPSFSKIKNILMSSFMMLNVKMKETKEYVFRTLLKQFGLESIVDQIDSNMKIKGRALMALKEYTRLNLRRAFWRWYLSSTDNGDKLFQNASDKLVLYTNINKTTFFYRLLNKVKVREIKVDPKAKRMTMMLYLYTKMYYQRPMREFFEKFKIVTSKRGEQDELRQNLIKCAKLREKDLFKNWIKSVKEHRQKQIKKKSMFDNFAKKLVQVSNQKKKWLLQEWKILAQKQTKTNELKARFLKRILITKASRMAEAFKLIKNLPNKASIESFKKVSKFEKGLIKFAQRTLKKALNAFKNEYENGQAQKKRAVIQLIQCTQGSQKKFYNRWKLLSEKTKFIQESKKMHGMLQTLFFAIKSTADIAFLENKESLLKQKALLQLFGNLSGSVSDTLKRWRELNKVLNLKDSVTQRQKEMMIKVLDGLLKNSKSTQIRNVVFKFRVNRRIIEIQRNFLKRLLLSKAGMVMNAFRKIQSIPEGSSLSDHKKASGLKFERGLTAFAERTLRRALNSFKNQYDKGQALKKRAVIQLIQLSQGGQRRYFNFWKSETRLNNLYLRCQLLQQFFQNSHKTIDKNYSTLFRTRSYSMQDVSKLHKYFTKLGTSANSDMFYIFDQLKQNASSRRVNKWFYRAAQTFAVRTRISMQKSLWRLKLNARTNGVLYDATFMVKMKKMYNTVRKYYELVLFRAFLMIDKYGKTVQSSENSQNVSRQSSDYVKIQGSFRDESSLFETANNQIEAFKQDQFFLAGRKASLAICENIFNQHVSQQLKRWKYHTQPQKQLEQINKQLQTQNFDTYAFVNQSKAVSLLFEKIRCKRLKDLAYGFRTLWHYGLELTNQTVMGQNIEERRDLIQRQNRMMEEVKVYQKQNEELLQEMELKETHLQEANKAVALLSLKINFLITTKFMELVQKVMDGINWRHLNSGFDGIIEMANENFEQQQSQQIYEQQEQEQEG